jgi:hypothetical protein
MAHQTVERRHLVIKTRAGEAQPQHQRRADRQQAFVEIRAVLFFNHVDRTIRQAGAICGGQRVHIADHGIRKMPRRHRNPCAAIGGHEFRPQRQRILQGFRIRLTPTDQGDRRGGVNNDVLHRLIMVQSGNRSQCKHKMIR